MQGFVVQNSVLQIEKNCKYRGTFRYRSWPTTYISNTYSPQSEIGAAKNDIFDLMDEYLDKTFTETETYLCDNIETVMRYAKALKDCGENVRILFVQTPDDFDSDNSFSANLNFLGYDVIYQCGFFSAIHDDLYINVPEPIQKYTRLLNPNGIFGEYSSAKAFLSDIDRCIEKGYDLEPSEGFDIIKLYEYINV